MPVSESNIAKVVAEASSKMHSPQYISNQVDLFMGAQPMISQYVLSFVSDLTMEGVMLVLFHAALIHRSISIAAGAEINLVSINELDMAAKVSSSLEELSETEPDLASYIASNIDVEKKEENTKLAHKLLAQIAKALTEKVD